MSEVRSVVLIADASFYDMCIERDVDIESLDMIDERLGKILVTEDTSKSVSKKVDNIKSSNRMIPWKERVWRDYSEYLTILKTPDVPDVSSVIEGETQLLRGILQKLCPGIDMEDTGLIANAEWIRRNTRFEPLIISDDSHLLICGHAISSFFGISLGVLSGYELLRLVKLDDVLDKYCKHFGLSRCKENFDNAWSEKKLDTNLSHFMRSGKLAFHPSLRNNESFLRISKRKKSPAR